MYPRLLHICGPLWIHGYGFMVAVGFLVFVYLLHKNPKRKLIISDELFFNTLFIGLLSGIIGGRLFFVIYEWHKLSGNYLEVFYPWVGGFGMLGAILGVLLVVPAYLKLKGVKVLKFFDVVAVYASLIEVFARIGCFLAGCCYGRVADHCSALTVTFTKPEGLAPLNVCLHPIQLYSSFVALCVFVIVFLREKHFGYKTGQIMFTYLLLSSTARFTLDFWRGDRDFVEDASFLKVFFETFSYSQFVALGIFIISLIGLFCISRKK